VHGKVVWNDENSENEKWFQGDQKRTQMPSSSPEPFSCYEMQRRQNDNLDVCPTLGLITGFIPKLGNNARP